MIFKSKKDKRNEIEENLCEVKETITKLNENILKKRKKKNDINKELADSSAELVYYRTLVKQFNDELRKIKD